MPKSKGRKKTRDRAAADARAAQETSEKKKLTPEQYMRRRAFGWILVSVGVLVAVSHWLQHLQFFELMSPGLSDLLIGYPTGAALGIWGAVVLSN